MLNTAQNDSFQATDVGFSVAHARERGEFRDEDVLGIRVEARRKSDAMGNPTLEETLHVRVNDTLGDRWISMVAEVGPWDEDPLSELRERLLNSLLERACESLLAADEVTGPGWSLSLIQFSDQFSGRTCSPYQISAVRWCNDQLCVFHESDAEPFGKYDRDAENTIVLHRIFEQLLDDGCETSDTRRPHGLGDLRKQVTAVQVRWLTPRRFATVSSVPVAAMVYALPIPLAAMGIVLLLLMFLVLMPLMTGKGPTLRLYDRAVAWTYGSDEVVLLLNQVTSLTAVHVSETQGKGAITPRLTLKLAVGDRDKRSIDFSTLITPENREALESIVIDSATTLALSMSDNLDKKGCVAWTEQLSIGEDAIIYQPDPDGSPQQILRSNIQGWSLSDTKLMIVLPAGDVVCVATSCPNFYPGLVLLHERGWFKPSRE